MSSGNEQTLTYQQAETAYIQGNYQEAAETIDSLVIADPENAKARLLRGHVYRRLQDYPQAQAEYESVLRMSADREVREYAENSLEEIRYAQSVSNDGGGFDIVTAESNGEEYVTAEANTADYQAQANRDYIDDSYQDFDAAVPADGSWSHNESNFDRGDDFNSVMPAGDSSWSDNISSEYDSNDYYVSPFELTAHLSSDLDYISTDASGEATYKLNVQSDYPVVGAEVPEWTDSDDFGGFTDGDLPLDRQKTMLLGSGTDKIPPALAGFNESADGEYNPQGQQASWEAEVREEEFFSTGSEIGEDYPDNGESFDFTADWKPELDPDREVLDDTNVSDGSNPFLEGFTEFKQASAPPSDRSVTGGDFEPDWQDFSGNLIVQTPASDSNDGYSASQSSIGGSDSFTVTTSTGSSSPGKNTSLTNLGSGSLEPRVTVKQGWLRPLENAPLKKKSLITAIACGVVSTVVVGIMAAALSGNVPAPRKGLNLWQRNALISLGAGAASFASTLGLMTLASRSIRRSTDDLESKLQDGMQGNFNTTAIVFSEDEFGRLSTRFNQMAGVMLAITSEAQRKAQEEEQKKEDLQRQVIRLLDDVEGAARGDLTVQAEVTADVLGAVADSFNLTIENLREIVQQVKSAAQQVNQESTTSEVIARNLSGEALRQAEELAVTLNSVQIITDSIKRVADNAKEAENVARSASLTALKGGDAVEKTVEGILGIRETVAESTRKVKRLAESSQEISKIVAVISQIASRTNMLALNASIEAARAGEAGRGFAIVADEVRQLADRSAKALKEIEQIVRQIQSDTGSVMTAMEEGTQQVIEGTKLAEKAKRSLEDIITVSNRIDSLVQSITADTVEQTQTSTTVAQVMQSVEMTAQATSQESQRVSVTLQNLVSVAQDLLNSVERFRVENN